MTSPTLTEIKLHLEQQVAGGVLSLSSVVLGQGLSLSNPLIAVLDKLAIRVQNPQIDFVGDELRVEGSAMLFSPYKARAVLMITESNGSLAPNIDLDMLSEMGQPMGLRDMIRRVLADVDVIPDGLSISRLSLGNFGDTALAAKIAGEWLVDLPTQMKLTDMEIKVGSEKGLLAGVADIGIAHTRFTASLPGDVTLEGDFPEVDALRLVPVPADIAVPAGLQLTIPESHYSVALGTSPRFALDLQDEDIRIACLTIEEQKDHKWGTAVAYRPKGWKFSRLARALSPLDVLILENMTLKYASQEGLVLTCLDPAHPMSVTKGFAIAGGLHMQGLGLDLLKKILHLDDILALDVSLAQKLEEMALTLSLGDIDLVGGGLIVLKNTRISVGVKPFSITLISKASLKIFDVSLPIPFAVGAGITESSMRILAETEQPWDRAFGIPGLTLRRLGFQMETPAAYCFWGQVTIGDKALALAACIQGAAWSAVAGRLEGRFSMGELLKSLIGLNIGFVGDFVTLRDFKFEYAATDITIGIAPNAVTIPQGIALEGILGIFGVEVDLKLAVHKEQGVYARARLPEAIDIGKGILRIYGKDENQGPEVELDTRGNAKKLALVGGGKLMGLGGNLAVEFNDAGLKATQDIQLGPLTGTATFEGQSPLNFKATGTFGFKLNLSVGPIKEPNTGFTLLPEFTLDAELTGTIDVTMRPGFFSQSVELKFKFWGVHFDLSLDVDTRDLTNLKTLIEDYIIKNSHRIFMRLFKDAPDPLAIIMGLRDSLMKLGQDLVKVFINFGDDAVAIFNTIGTVDLLALPAIGALSIKGWQTMKPEDWLNAASWKTPVWMDVASWSDDLWDGIASGKIERKALTELKNFDHAKNEYFEKIGLGGVVKGGEWFKEGVGDLGHGIGGFIEHTGDLSTQVAKGVEKTLRIKF